MPVFSIIDTLNVVDSEGVIAAKILASDAFTTPKSRTTGSLTSSDSLLKHIENLDIALGSDLTGLGNRSGQGTSLSNSIDILANINKLDSAIGSDYTSTVFISSTDVLMASISKLDAQINTLSSGSNPQGFIRFITGDTTTYDGGGDVVESSAGDSRPSDSETYSNDSEWFSGVNDGDELITIAGDKYTASKTTTITWSLDGSFTNNDKDLWAIGVDLPDSPSGQELSALYIYRSSLAQYVKYGEVSDIGSSATLQDAYDNGETIQVSGAAVPVEIRETSNFDQLLRIADSSGNSILRLDRGGLQAYNSGGFNTAALGGFSTPNQLTLGNGPQSLAGTIRLEVGNTPTNDYLVIFPGTDSSIQVTGSAISQRALLAEHTGEAVYKSAEVDLKTATNTVDITVPSTKVFFVSEVGVILTTLGGTITGQPTISIGTNTDTTRFVNMSTTTLLTAENTKETTSVSTSSSSAAGIDGGSGENIIRLTVDTGATGSSNIDGTLYVKGFYL